MHTHHHQPARRDMNAQLADTCADLIRRGLEYGNEQVLGVIKAEAIAVDEGDSLRWYDVRPMLDLREHHPETVDAHAAALQYALDIGLVYEHATKPGLVLVAPGLVL